MATEHRSFSFDGLQLDGLQPDGLQLDGLRLDGLQLDGFQRDGLQPCGLQLNRPHNFLPQLGRLASCDPKEPGLRAVRLPVRNGPDSPARFS